MERWGSYNARFIVTIDVLMITKGEKIGFVVRELQNGSNWNNNELTGHTLVKGAKP